jgi:hypothetical protein
MAFIETLKTVPDQFLDLLDVTQQAVLTNASAFVATATSLTPQTPVLSFADPLRDPAGLSDSTFTFAEKLLASQREFSHKLIETCLPVKAPTPAKAPTPKST